MPGSLFLWELGGGGNHSIFQSSESATGSSGPIHVHLVDPDSKHDHTWLRSELLYPIFLQMILSPFCSLGRVSMEDS